MSYTVWGWIAGMLVALVTYYTLNAFIDINNLVVPFLFGVMFGAVGIIIGTALEGKDL